MRNVRSGSLAIVLLVASLLIVNVPLTNASDEAPVDVLRVSLVQDFMDIDEQAADQLLFNVLYHFPEYYTEVYPEIDSNNNIQYSIHMVRFNETGAADISIVHVIDLVDGGYVNSTVISWHISPSEWQTERYQWTELYSRIFLDPQDNPYILYQLGINEPEFLSLAHNEEGNWTSVDLPTGLNFRLFSKDNIDLVIDERGRVHIAYLQDNILRYMNNAGGDWNTYSIDSVDHSRSDMNPNINIDTNGLLHIYYVDVDWNAVDATLINGVWRKTVIFDNPGDLVSYPRYSVLYMTQDSNDHYHIYYRLETSGQQTIFYMTNSGGTWINATVPEYENQYWYGGRFFEEDCVVRPNIRESIVDGDGIPEWYSFTRVYKWSGSEWQTHDLSTFNNMDGRTLIANEDGSFDIFSTQHQVRYSITSAWPTDHTNSPTTLTAIPEDGSVNLSWQASEKALSYRIYCKDPFTDLFIIVNETNSTLFVDEGRMTYGSNDNGIWDPHNFKLFNGLEYVYTVTALTADGESAPSNFVSVIPRTVPKAPEEFFAFYDGNSIALIWSPPTADGGAEITGYDVVCKDLEQNVLWNESLGNVTIYDTEDFVPGEAYMFRVTAKNVAGDGGSSSFEYVVPSADEVPFYVLSQKSSTSNVRFDNESKTITFTVSGSDGSLGSSFVVIPKDLVGNGSELRATIDGSDLPIIVQETDSAYVISMSYHHSTHELVVYWGEDSWLSEYLIPILVVVAAALVAVGIVWYVKRRRG